MQTVQETDAQRRARNLAALLDLGFECAPEPLAVEAIPTEKGGWRVSHAVPSMGTVVTVSVLDESQDRAESALGRAFAEMERTAALLNRYDAASALGVLNSESGLAGAPDELLQVLHRARGVHLLSNGAFDVTVAPLIDAFREHRDAGHPGLPAAATLAEAQSRVDASGVVINGRQVRLDDGVDVTLDGIAKGFVVDSMALVLAASGVSGYLINGGGDIRTAGTRDGTQPWRVGVRDPDRDGEQLQILPLFDGAVATSGSYEIYFDRDRTHHHIVSSTGVSPGECRSVTVRAPSTMLADALATAAFVAGPQAGALLVESVPGCSCLVLDAQGTLRPSASWLPDSRTGAS